MVARNMVSRSLYIFRRVCYRRGDQSCSTAGRRHKRGGCGDRRNISGGRADEHRQAPGTHAARTSASPHTPFCAHAGTLVARTYFLTAGAQRRLGMRGRRWRVERRRRWAHNILLQAAICCVLSRVLTFCAYSEVASLPQHGGRASGGAGSSVSWTRRTRRRRIAAWQNNVDQQNARGALGRHRMVPRRADARRALPYVSWRCRAFIAHVGVERARRRASLVLAAASNVIAW